MVETRYCARCRQDVDLSEWLKNPARSSGFQAYCRECHKVYNRERYVKGNGAIRARRRRLAREFGITLERYDEMVREQNGRCAICDDEDDLLHIDHCHDTGKVRGLLCGRCNRAIGLLLDSPARALAAAAYLQRHS